MSILSALADTFLGGGATGLISAGVTMWAKIAEKKIDKAHEEKRWDYTLHMTRENALHESKLADKNILISKQVGADNLRLSAINAEDNLTKLSGNVFMWVNSVRSLHRVFLTYVLIGVAIYMHVVATGQAAGFIESTEPQLLLTIFVTNAAASAVGFWFGDRIISPHKR
jgi:hypothetical protein